MDNQGLKFKISNYDSMAAYDIVTFRGYNSNHDWNEYVTEKGEELDVRQATLNSIIQNGIKDDNVQFYDWDISKETTYEFQ